MGDYRDRITGAMRGGSYGPQDLRSPSWPGYKPDHDVVDAVGPMPENDDERAYAALYDKMSGLAGGKTNDFANDHRTFEDGMMAAYQNDPSRMGDIRQFRDRNFPASVDPSAPTFDEHGDRQKMRLPWERVPRRGKPTS